MYNKDFWCNSRFSFIPRQGHKKGSVSIYSKAFYLTWRELPPCHQNRGV